MVTTIAADDLEGVGPEHAHAAASLLRAIDLLEAELRDLQERVTAHLAAIPASWGVDADGVTGRLPRAPRSSRPRGWWMSIPAWAGRPPPR